MSFWDTIFGDEDTRAAIRNKSYLDPQGVTDPDPARQKALRDAAISAGRRMDISADFANMAKAMAESRAKGGKFLDQLSAGGVGFATGSDQTLKQQYMQAQTRGAQAQARKHEAEAKSLSINRPQTVRDQYGRVQRWNGRRYVPVPEYDQQGYAKVDLPPMPGDYQNPDNPNQTVVAPPGGSTPGRFQGQPRPTYTDTTTGQVYDWIGGKWVPRS